MSNRSLTAGLIMAGAIMLTACSSSVNNVETEPVRLENYEYTDESVFSLQMDADNKDITPYVVNYKNAQVYVSQDFLSDIGMNEDEVTDEDLKSFKKAEAENDISFPDSVPVKKYSGNGHELMIREGGKLYICDGEDKMFGQAVIKTSEGKYSLPLTELLLAIGYDNAGISVDDEEITVTVM